MTLAEQRIKKLKKETKEQIFNFFDSLDEFYETFYLMIKNEHQSMGDLQQFIITSSMLNINTLSTLKD